MRRRSRKPANIFESFWLALRDVNLDVHPVQHHPSIDSYEDKRENVRPLAQAFHDRTGQLLVFLLSVSLNASARQDLLRPSISNIHLYAILDTGSHSTVSPTNFTS